MKIKELNEKHKSYLKNHNLIKKFEKVKNLFEQDYRHPSLNVEILEPKSLKIYSFRIDLKYRAILLLLKMKLRLFQ